MFETKKDMVRIFSKMNSNLNINAAKCLKDKTKSEILKDHGVKVSTVFKSNIFWENKKCYSDGLKLLRSVKKNMAW